jgi:hypothetical protein
VEPNELVIEPKVVPRGRAPGVTAMLARPVLSNRLGSDAVQPDSVRGAHLFSGPR